jgi:carbonic anhydrase/acetyltransferase-like protein (isoleucine patch superfamily)
MIRKNPNGDLPHIHPDAFVDPTAIICGKVIIEANVFIGPYAVIRADELDANGDIEPIIIKAHSNIQDGVVIHSKSGAQVMIGKHTSEPSFMAHAKSAMAYSLDSIACYSTAKSTMVPW